MGRKRIIVISFILVIAVSLASCSDEKNSESRKTILNLPDESFIITDLEYSQEKGLQVSGFTKAGPHSMTVSVWNYKDNGKWEQEFQKDFSCNPERKIEGQIYWSSNVGVIIPYTWTSDDTNSGELKEEYYYINTNGDPEKLRTKGLSGISNMVFTNKDEAYWRNFEKGSLKKWNFQQGTTPEEIKLAEVNLVNRIAYADDCLYILGFEGDAALYDVKKEQEIPCTENLMTLSEELFATDDIGGNEFAFVPYADEDQHEILYYIDNTGLWEYRDGKKTKLLDGIEEEFGEKTYFIDIVVKDEKTIFIALLRSDNGILTEDLWQYDLNQ